MFKKLAAKLRRDERGITGLETAIILISFVVIATVFAYTVLAAGIFSAQKGQEAIFGALGETRSTLMIKGSVVARTGGGNSITSVEFVVSNAINGESIDLTPPADIDADGLADATSTNVTTIKYTSGNQSINDVDWSQTEIGRGDGDAMLEDQEQIMITVDLTGVGESIVAYKKFTIELKPPVGSVLRIEKIAPPSLDPVMILD